MRFFVISVLILLSMACDGTDDSSTASVNQKPLKPEATESETESEKPKSEDEKFMSQIRQEAGIEGMDSDESLDKLRADQTWSKDNQDQ